MEISFCDIENNFFSLKKKQPKIIKFIKVILGIGEGTTVTVYIPPF